MTRASQNRKIFPKIVGSLRLTHLPNYEPPFFNDNQNEGAPYTPPGVTFEFLAEDGSGKFVSENTGTRFEQEQGP